MAAQMAEFIAVWSLIGALAACPWVSAAACSETGYFVRPTSTRLWALCCGLLVVAFVAFVVLLRRSVAEGKSIGRACGVFVGHTAVSLVILIVTFMVADVVVAHVKPLPVAAYLDVPKAQIYGWAYASLQAVVTRNPDTGEIYRDRTNSQGWRDVEHPSVKTVPRLLLLGDSQAFGTGVPFEQTIGRHLQGLLGGRWEILSIGIPGWGTDQEFLALENDGLAYHPDVVVLLFTMSNDVMNNMYDRAFFGTARKPIFRLVGENLELEPLPKTRPPLLRRLFGRSTLCRYIRLWNQARRAKGGSGLPSYAEIPGERASSLGYDSSAEDMENDYSHNSIFGETWSARLAEAWSLTLRLILEMDRACRSHGATLVVYPCGQAPTPTFRVPWTNRGKTYWLDPAKPFRRLREFCEREGIAYVEEPADFRLDYARGLARYVAEGHLNPDGNRRVAEIIAHGIEGQIEPGQTAADTKAQSRDP